MSSDFLKNLLRFLADELAPSEPPQDGFDIEDFAEDEEEENPYLAEEAPGIAIYGVLSDAAKALWPLAVADHEDLFKTAESLVQGTWTVLTGMEVVDDYAVLYEAARLLRDNVRYMDDLSYPYFTDGDEADTFSIKDEVVDFCESVIEGDMAHAMWVADQLDIRFNGFEYASGVGCQTLTAAVLIVCALRHAEEEWPEIADAFAKVPMSEEGDEDE